MRYQVRSSLRATVHGERLTAMLDEYLYLQQKRRRSRRLDFHVSIGSVLCALAATYLLCAALVGLIAQ